MTVIPPGMWFRKTNTAWIVTHTMQRTVRRSDDGGSTSLGRCNAFGRVRQICTAPRERETQDYITGRFG
jgi:phosphate transport system ATP-binding protein